MFQIDRNRIKVCIDYDDYFSALEYAILVKELYKDREKSYFEEIIKKIKSGAYKKIRLN